MLAFQAGAAVAFGALRAWLMSTFDWVLMGAANFFVLFCLLLLVTPLGRVRLGGADARPDYSRSAWFAMLFAAGTGIGLMFFGVSEPVEHFLQPPLGLEAADTEAAARLGMASAIYHWGIHGWAMYAVVGVAIAFASYNLGLPLALRSAFYPLMGEAVWGRFGHVLEHSRRLRHALRAGHVARPGRRAVGGGAGPPVGHAGDRHHPGAADRRHHGHGAGVGRSAEWRGGSSG